MRRRDAAIAIGSGVLSVGSLVVASVTDETSTSAEPGSLGWWLVIATVTAQNVLLLWVRSRPSVVLVATACLSVVAAVAGSGDGTSITTIPVVVATFVVGISQPWSAAWPVLAAAAVLTATADSIGVRSPLGVAQALSTLGLTLLVATFVATRREAVRAREQEVRALQREQNALVQAAIARERTAMARELHDIAAHHLSGIAVMTAAISTQIDTDPAGAKQAAAQVREQSREVLRDLRSLVGLLREGDESSDTRPENLKGVGALVADAARTGRSAELTTLAGRRELGAGVGPLAQLAAYRVVQEALANAARHAPGGRCEVTVDDRAEDAVVVEVRNGPPTGTPEGRGGGFGLVGMRERAELTGATLEAGPTDDGGWRVAMRLPREPQPEAPDAAAGEESVEHTEVES